MPSDDTTQKLRKELNAGTAALAVLAAVAGAGRPIYGYELARLLENAAGELPMQAGALYPVLRSLARQRLLETSDHPSETGPPRRYYAATPRGREVLTEWIAAWHKTRNFLTAILEPGDAHGQSDDPPGSPAISHGPRSRPQTDSRNSPG